MGFLLIKVFNWEIHTHRSRDNTSKKTLNWSREIKDAIKLAAEPEKYNLVNFNRTSNYRVEKVNSIELLAPNRSSRTLSLQLASHKLATEMKVEGEVRDWEWKLEWRWICRARIVSQMYAYSDLAKEFWDWWGTISSISFALFYILFIYFFKRFFHFLRLCCLICFKF